MIQSTVLHRDHFVCFPHENSQKSVYSNVKCSLVQFRGSVLLHKFAFQIVKTSVAENANPYTDFQNSKMLKVYVCFIILKIH